MQVLKNSLLWAKFVTRMSYLIGGLSNPFKALTIISLVLLSFTFSSQNNENAIVNKIDGYYIFIESKPTSAHEVLGSIDAPGVVWNGRPKEMMKVMLKRLKQQHPKADAIIFDSYRMEHAQAIKFN
jgi:hypothetical protein